MLTHFGNFLCSIGGKGPFKTDLSLWRLALPVCFFIHLGNRGLRRKYIFHLPVKRRPTTILWTLPHWAHGVCQAQYLQSRGFRFTPYCRLIHRRQRWACCGEKSCSIQISQLWIWKVEINFQLPVSYNIAQKFREIHILMYMLNN